MNHRLCAALLLLSGLVATTGCQRNSRHLAVTPPLQPDPAPTMVSVPPPSHPSEPLPVQPVVATPPTIATPAAPRKIRKPRKSPPAAAPVVPTQAAAAPPAQTVTPPAVTAGPNPLGQLSTGGESTAENLQGAGDLVRAQQARLQGLSAALQSQQKTEVEQVKHFLDGADDALKSSDAEGARTLAVKAKVLLDELQK